MLVFLTGMSALSYNACYRTLATTVYDNKTKETEYALSNEYSLRQQIRRASLSRYQPTVRLVTNMKNHIKKSIVF